MTLSDLVADSGDQSLDFAAFKKGEYIGCSLLYNQEDSHQILGPTVYFHSR